MSDNKIKIDISGGTAEFGNIIQGNANIVSDNAQDRKNKTKLSSKVFISYRRSDSANVSGRIYDRLINKIGQENVFKDVYSIPLGVNFKEYIIKEISKADVLLAIIGNGWLGLDKSGSRIKDSQDFVRLEITGAFENNIPVIPIFVSNSTMPSERDLPEELKQLVYINGIKIRTDPDFENDINSLLVALKKF